MSKIFDALQRGQDELSGLIVSSVCDQPANGVTAPPPPGGTEEEAPSPTAGEAPPEPTAADTYETVRLSVTAPILPFTNHRHMAGEQYRIIRTKIAQHPSRPQILLVSSPGAGDGKTITAINLASALSLKSEGEVLLVDADFRRSNIPFRLGLAPRAGIAEVMAGTCALQDAIVRAEQLPSLCALGAGELQKNPAELLDSPKWLALCGRFRQSFRYVVLDSPPVAAVADYDLLQAIADGVIVVARPDHTPRQLLFKALEAIPKEKLLGVVLNRVPKWFLSKSFGQDYYYYYSNGR